ncbi:transposase [Flavobacterium branchiarum]|uniref:ISAon1 family transposase n=1 Tax=Flavobacterium branchiarum TaxID=1114870 RepID=UPI0025B60EC5|nr:transposase [Flavobacterium branchiarum]MDN3672771.1 transposase [Flavobacterium branchiarum]
MDKNPVSASKFGSYYNTDGKKLQYLYKNHLSDFKLWSQKQHAKQWLLFGKNLGMYLSLDETSLSNGELYTVLTNKAAKGKKGAIVAIVKGTKAEVIIELLNRIPPSRRDMVKEVTVDMASNMNLIVKKCFPKSQIVTDRFHVQKLATQAVQEERIKLRWEIIEQENIQYERSKNTGKPYSPELLSNGDTKKQLLARSRYVLFKTPNKWTTSQALRAQLLFELYPSIKKAYKLAQGLCYIYENNTNKNTARLKLAQWYNTVEDSGFRSFNTIAKSIQIHYESILNYFNNRSTNASAESFNAKIKEFRAQFRGVRDIEFFLYRLTKLYA